MTGAWPGEEGAEVWPGEGEGGRGLANSQAKNTGLTTGAGNPLLLPETRSEEFREGEKEGSRCPRAGHTAARPA